MVNFKFDDSNPLGGFGKSGKKNAPVQLPRMSPQDLMDFVLHHKSAMVSFASIVVTAGYLLVVFGGQMQQISAMDQDIRLLQDKDQPSRDLTKTTSESKAFFGALPVILPENRFITQLTTLANKRNVSVTAISPPENKEYGFFRRVTSQLTCSVNGVKDALLFINDIEQSEFALKVDSWKVRHLDAESNNARMRGEDPAGKAAANASTKLDMVIVVSSVGILDNGKNE